MSAILRTQSIRAPLRAVPAPARAVSSRPRTYATIPDPTHPTDAPKPNDVPKPSGGGGTNLILFTAGLAGVAGGYYWFIKSPTDPHAQRKADEEQVKEHAGKLREAGQATAHDAVREGQQKYDETKSAAQDKVLQARAQASQTFNDARSTATRQYDNAKATVVDAAHKVEHKYEDAANKTKAEAQSWNGWFWSWFGYGEQKADDAKRQGAQKVVEGAQKVEKEAGKHT